MLLDTFRNLVRANAFDELLSQHMLGGLTEHVSDDNIEYIEERVRSKLDAARGKDDFYGVVGSAKLGFSTNEKRLQNGTLLPRYRMFSTDSDIDVVVVSTTIFTKVWHELSGHAHRSTPRLPWNSGALGDYILHGWLRPDLFPNARLQSCDDWWDVFRSLSANPRFGRRKVRGGLFYSMEHLRLYQGRTLKDCARFEEINR